jgi:hypothetical protein
MTALKAVTPGEERYPREKMVPHWIRFLESLNSIGKE